MIRSLARWVLRGERNVTRSLDALTADLQQLQRSVDELSARTPAPIPADGVGPTPPSDTAPTRWEVAPSLRSDGVNLVGYLDHQLSLGDSGRRVATALVDHGVPTTPLAFAGAVSPPIHESFPTSSTIEFDTTIAVIAADQLPLLHDRHPELASATRRMIGLCFWELETLSDATLRGARLLDEVWVATSFVREAFETVDGLTVRHVPFPVPEPRPSNRSRSSFPPFVEAGERVVFGATFDYFSVFERKNPLGVIEAYRRAFGPDDGAFLVVKTLNAAALPDHHERLLAAAADRSDIAIWDAHLDTADQARFLQQLDVIVALHRSEGLGVHLAEAMWLGVPVIATGYSGNVDFIDDTCGRLVDHALVGVDDGGDIYPRGARWADPDLDHAAGILRELADDAALRSTLGAAGRERMLAGPSGADFAAAARSLLGLAAD